MWVELRISKKRAQARHFSNHAFPVLILFDSTAWYGLMPKGSVVVCSRLVVVLDFLFE